MVSKYPKGGETWLCLWPKWLLSFTNPWFGELEWMCRARFKKRTFSSSAPLNTLISDCWQWFIARGHSGALYQWWLVSEIDFWYVPGETWWFIDHCHAVFSSVSKNVAFALIKRTKSVPAGVCEILSHIFVFSRVFLSLIKTKLLNKGWILADLQTLWDNYESTMSNYEA